MSCARIDPQTPLDMQYSIKWNNHMKNFQKTLPKASNRIADNDTNIAIFFISKN